ncbi:MAG: hypothetical protein M1609_16870 [Firmicutes bacterium]|nr:hypothetical protein [Bacillota bacterium]
MFDIRCFIYLIFAVVTGFAALVVIPKKLYKKYLLYSILLGGTVDAVLAPIFSKVFHLIKYNNMGYFDILDVFSFWTPITWMFAFSIFFYLLPVQKFFLVPYLIIWTGLSYSVGIVLHDFGLFEYIGIGKFIMPVVFCLWYSTAAWVYLKTEKISLK